MPSLGQASMHLPQLMQSGLFHDLICIKLHGADLLAPTAVDVSFSIHFQPVLYDRQRPLLHSVGRMGLDPGAMQVHLSACPGASTIALLQKYAIVIAIIGIIDDHIALSHFNVIDR